MEYNITIMVLSTQGVQYEKQCQLGRCTSSRCEMAKAIEALGPFVHHTPGRLRLAVPQPPSHLAIRKVSHSTEVRTQLRSGLFHCRAKNR